MTQFELHPFSPLVYLFRALRYVQKHWFDIALILLTLYVFLEKKVDIQLNLSSPEVTEIIPAQAQNISMLAPQTAEKSASAKAKQTPTTDERQANTFSNLTFILSPTYAERHNIPPAIVEEKREIVRQYLETYAPIARREREKYGIPVSITLAQGLLESNVGESRLAQESNNHFGIKCRSKCRGCTCRNYTDDSRYDMFRVFESPWESYREHSILLNGGRYKHLLKLPMTDYKNWAHGLKKAGYATDKRYAYKLIQIIEHLELDRYDRGV